MAEVEAVVIEVDTNTSLETPHSENVIEVVPPTDDTLLTYRPLKDDLSALVRSACSLMPPADFVVGPTNCVLPNNYSNYAKRIRDLEVREDDVWVLSFPKCGSRLVREITWLLKNGLDCGQATSKELHERFLFLEYICLWPEGADQPDTVEMVEGALSPRFIKSNLPLELLPRQLWTKKPKIIYVGRNPKDSAVAYLSHYQRFYQYSGTQDQFFQAFHHDRVVFSPFWEHVLAFWDKRKEQNFLFATYEEMNQNLSSSIRKLSAFLGVALSTEAESTLVTYLQKDEETVDDISKQTSEEEPADEEGEVAPPVVKPRSTSVKPPHTEVGGAGGWRANMTPSCAEKFDKWTKEKLAGTDFSNVFMII